jgi:Rod binding domain-containing protein
MSGGAFKIQAPPLAMTTVQAAKPATTTDAAAKKKEEHAKVGRDFEAILVRQMLTQAKVAGKSGGYADMAVESLATSVTSAGGLGMGRAIEDTLNRAMVHQQIKPAHTAAHGEATSKEPLKPLKSSGINPTEEK